MTALAYSFYSAGELFSLKALMGNSALAVAIHQASDGRYQAVLPQSLEQRDQRPAAIRNSDIRAVWRSDLALFQFDGTELDSGTVVEYMIAKFLDIPAVILRTDFRAAGDNGEQPWNLMVSCFPRTELVSCHAMLEYQDELSTAGPASSDHISNLTASTRACEVVTMKMAKQVVAAFDRLIVSPPLLSPEAREAVYQWARIMPGGQFDSFLGLEELQALLKVKIQKKLL